MGEKKNFQKLVDAVLNKNVQSKDSASKTQLSTEDVLQILENLNQQIEEQREDISRLEGKVKQFDENFKLLIKKLVISGYIKKGERRNLLKRNSITQDALVNLLKKKHVISIRELLSEIGKLRQREGTHQAGK